MSKGRAGLFAMDEDLAAEQNNGQVFNEGSEEENEVGQDVVVGEVTKTETTSSKAGEPVDAREFLKKSLEERAAAVSGMNAVSPKRPYSAQPNPSPASSDRKEMRRSAPAASGVGRQAADSKQLVFLTPAARFPILTVPVSPKKVPNPVVVVQLAAQALVKREKTHQEQVDEFCDFLASDKLNDAEKKQVVQVINEVIGVYANQTFSLGEIAKAKNVLARAVTNKYSSVLDEQEDLLPGFLKDVTSKLDKKHPLQKYIKEPTFFEFEEEEVTVSETKPVSAPRAQPVAKVAEKPAIRISPTLVIQPKQPAPNNVLDGDGSSYRTPRDTSFLQVTAVRQTGSALNTAEVRKFAGVAMIPPSQLVRNGASTTGEMPEQALLKSEQNGGRKL